MFCFKCGTKVADDAVFCQNCGNKIRAEVKPQNTGVDKTKNSEEASAWWGVLGFFFPIVGVILFAVWYGEKPDHSKKAGIGAIIGGIISIILSIIVTILWIFLIKEIMENGSVVVPVNPYL